VAVASVVIGVAPAAFAAAIATLQAIAVASRERAATRATTAACPHLPTGPAFVTADASIPAGPAMGVAGSMAAVVGAPAGTAVGTISSHPLDGLLFLAGYASAPLAPSRAPPGPWTLQLPLAPRRHRRWHPRLAVLRPVHRWSPVLVDAARLFRSTPVWVSGAARLVILL
jgi:hypothetical protein